MCDSYFDAFKNEVVLRHGFVLIQQMQDDALGYLADYENEFLGLQMLLDHYGPEVFVRGRSDEKYYGIRDVLRYLVGEDAKDASIDVLAALFDANYEKIVELFSRDRDALLPHFSSWIRELNYERFHFDQS